LFILIECEKPCSVAIFHSHKTNISVSQQHYLFHTYTSLPHDFHVLKEKIWVPHPTFKKMRYPAGGYVGRANLRAETRNGFHLIAGTTQARAGLGKMPRLHPYIEE